MQQNKIIPSRVLERGGFSNCWNWHPHPPFFNFSPLPIFLFSLSIRNNFSSSSDEGIIAFNFVMRKLLIKVSHDVDDGEFEEERVEEEEKEEERVEESRSSTNSPIFKWFGKGGKTSNIIYFYMFQYNIFSHLKRLKKRERRKKYYSTLDATTSTKAIIRQIM